MNNFEKFIRNSVPAKKDVDDFLNKDMLTMFQFDPEVGYILGNFLRNDGIDNSSSLYSVQSNGTRTSVVYADRAGRINTYGNSFTQCSQVSDYETWFVAGGSAVAALYEFKQPGTYVYLNHNLIEAVLYDAAAHIQVDGEWNDDLMVQIKK